MNKILTGLASLATALYLGLPKNAEASSDQDVNPPSQIEMISQVGIPIFEDRAPPEPVPPPPVHRHRYTPPPEEPEPEPRRYPIRCDGVRVNFSAPVQAECEVTRYDGRTP